MKPIRILFVRNCRGITNVTGGETYLLSLMEGLDPKKYTCLLLCVTNPRLGQTPWLKELQSRSLSYVSVEVSNLMSIKDLIALLKGIRWFHPDIIHSLDHRSDFVAVMAAKVCRKPVVASTLGWVNFIPGSFRARVYPWLDIQALKMTDTVLTDSVAFARGLRLGSNGPPIVPIPNGVDIRKFDPSRVNGDFKNRFFGDDDVLVLGMVGRIHPVKAQMDFLKVAADLSRSHSRCRYLIIGPVPAGFEGYKQELKRYIADNGLDNRVVMKEVTSIEIPAVMATIDILLAPSLAESFSFSLLEAMAMRKAVVASNVGGTGEIITHGINGMLIQSGDWHALKREAQALIEDFELRVSLGKKARHKIVNELSKDVMAARIGEVYDAIVQERDTGDRGIVTEIRLRKRLAQIAAAANPTYSNGS